MNSFGKKVEIKEKLEMRRIIKYRLPSSVIKCAIFFCVVLVFMGCGKNEELKDPNEFPTKVVMADSIEERLTKIALEETLGRKEFGDDEVMNYLLSLIKKGARRLAYDNDGRVATELQMTNAEDNLKKLISAMGEKLSATDSVNVTNLIDWIQDNVCPLYPFC